MDQEPRGGGIEDTSGAAPPVDAGSGGAERDEAQGRGAPVPVADDAEDHESAVPVEDTSPAAEIIELEWDDDLPVALGEEVDEAGAEVEEISEGDVQVEASDDAGAADDDDDEWDEDPLAPSRVARRNALPRRVESWRSRSASGAIATAIAMGLQQVFEPEKKRPAAVAEAPSDPYSDDDPITVDYVPDDAEATTVHVKPWLLEKGDPA